VGSGLLLLGGGSSSEAVMGRRCRRTGEGARLRVELGRISIKVLELVVGELLVDFLMFVMLV
jgi:hypothetical protein